MSSCRRNSGDSSRTMYHGPPWLSNPSNRATFRTCLFGKQLAYKRELWIPGPLSADNEAATSMPSTVMWRRRTVALKSSLMLVPSVLCLNCNWIGTSPHWRIAPGYDANNPVRQSLWSPGSHLGPERVIRTNSFKTLQHCVGDGLRQITKLLVLALCALRVGKVLQDRVDGCDAIQKRVRMRCAQWMMRTVFFVIRLGPKTSDCEKNVTVVSTVTLWCDQHLSRQCVFTFMTKTDCAQCASCDLCTRYVCVQQLNVCTSLGNKKILSSDTSKQLSEEAAQRVAPFKIAALSTNSEGIDFDEFLSSTSGHSTATMMCWMKMTTDAISDTSRKESVQVALLQTHNEDGASLLMLRWNLNGVSSVHFCQMCLEKDRFFPN